MLTPADIQQTRIVANAIRVRAATTANITIATALNAGDTLDGVTLVADDLVLVKDQSTAAQNGLYFVNVVPDRQAHFSSRERGLTAAYDNHPGILVVVEQGTVNADTTWLCTSNRGGTLDTTAIAFTRMLAAVGAQPLDADLTTIAGLADPNADRILFWDDSAGAYAYLAASTGLNITTTNLTVDQAFSPTWTGTHIFSAKATFTDGFNIGTDHTHVIASGGITITTAGIILIDTEAAAATDTIDTIAGGANGDVIVIRSIDSARDPTLVDGDGGDALVLAGNFTLSTTRDSITLMKSSSGWIELSRSDNA